MDTFDPNDAKYDREGLPEAFLAEVRRTGGTCPVPGGGIFVGRYEQVEAIFADPLTFHATLNFSGEPVSDDDLYLPEIEEPRHGEIRRVFNSFFSHHRSRHFESSIRRICAALLEPMVHGGGGDLVSGFTRQVPSRTLVGALGLPEEDADDLVRWSTDGVLSPRGVGSEDLPIHRYLRAQIATRMAETERPNDFLTRLIETPVGGAPLSANAIRAQMQIVIVAAVDTTTKLLGNLFGVLLHDPTLYARVRADRELVPRLVEETLRFAPPAWAPYRITRRPVDALGMSIEAGRLVRVGIGSANRDERVFESPHVFDIDRANARDHLAFGGGPHVCPGASLARLEGRIALESMLDRVAEIRPHPSAVYEPIPTIDVTRPRSLPAVMVPA